MLTQLREDIKDRLEDINRIIDVRKSTSIDDDQLRNILASSIILSSYNLMEFMTRESIISVIDSIKDQRYHVLDIKDEIQKKLIENAQNQQISKSFPLLFNKSHCQLEVNAKKIIDGGSVDGLFLKKTLKDFSIHENDNCFPKCRTTLDLKNVKDARNQLAHGNKAFRESSYSDDEINALFEHIEAVVNYTMDQLEICLNDKKYLKI